MHYLGLMCFMGWLHVECEHCMVRVLHGTSLTIHAFDRRTNKQTESRQQERTQTELDAHYKWKLI